MITYVCNCIAKCILQSFLYDQIEINEQPAAPC